LDTIKKLNEKIVELQLLKKQRNDALVNQRFKIFSMLPENQNLPAVPIDVSINQTKDLKEIEKISH